MRRMLLRLLCTGLLLVACTPAEGGTTEGSSSGTSEPGTGGTTPTSGEASTGTGGAPVECINGGLGAAFSWATPPSPGVAQCTRISDDLLAFDCSGDFSGIFTLMVGNPGVLGIVTGDPIEIDYRHTMDGDTVTGEWLRIRGQNQWYIVAAQGPTLAPPDAPADWFHPNVAVTVRSGDCAAALCGDGSNDMNTPLAIAFGQGDVSITLAPGKDGGVPGEFGGERYQAAVTEAHTGLCGGGEAGAGVDLLGFSVVSSGLL